MATGKVFTQSRILYCAAALLALLMAIAAFESPAGAWPLCLAAIACVAIANLERFSEISAGAAGVRIMMRDATEKADRLANIARVTSKAALSLVQSAGRSGGFSDEEKEAFLQEATQILRLSGLSDDEITEIRKDSWDRYVKFDYVLAITGNNIVPRDFDDDTRAEWKMLRDFTAIPSPEALEDFLRRTNSLHGLRSDLLSEYRYYCEHLSHRRPEIWHERRKVPRLPD